MILLVCSLASLTLSTVDNENSLSAKNENNDLSSTIVVDTPKVDTAVVEQKSTREVIGTAAWYNLPGRKTLSGEMFNKHSMTAASLGLKLKIGTKVRVTNLKNNKSIVVVINDSGSNRTHLIDLPKGTFTKLAPLSSGIIKVKIEVLI